MMEIYAELENKNPFVGAQFRIVADEIELLHLRINELSRAILAIEEALVPLSRIAETLIAERELRIKSPNHSLKKHENP